MRFPFLTFLVYFRFFRIDNGTGHHFPGILQIAIHLLRPHEHILRRVVEVIGLFGILGQIVDEFDPEANEIPNGVLVLEIGQSPNQRNSLFVIVSSNRFAKAGIDPFDYIMPGSFLRLLLIFRRHFAAFQSLQNPFPSFEILVRKGILAKIMESHLAFALLRTMATDAVFLEETLDRFMSEVRKSCRSPCEHT